MSPKMNSLVLVGVAVALVIGAPTTAAKPSRSKLRVSAPAGTTVGVPYSLSVSGKAVRKANSLRGVQVQDTPCRSTWKAEAALETNVAFGGHVHGAFSRTKHFSTGNVPGHTWYFCAYLINRKSKRTFAHAGAAFAAR